MANLIATHSVPMARTFFETAESGDTVEHSQDICRESYRLPAVEQSEGQTAPDNDALRTERLLVEVQTTNSALAVTTYPFMQDVRSAEALLYYKRSVKDLDTLETILARRLAIERRLKDRRDKVSRKSEHGASLKRVKFVLDAFEKAQIRGAIARLRRARIKPGTPEMAELLHPLGGYCLSEYERIIAKYIDNHGEEILQQIQAQSSHTLVEGLLNAERI